MSTTITIPRYIKYLTPDQRKARCLASIVAIHIKWRRQS